MSMEELMQYGKCAMAIIPVYGTTNSALTASVVDARGFDRAAFFILTGAMDALCVIQMSVTQAATAGGTYSLISNSNLSNIASTAGKQKVYVIDVPVSGSKPFLKLRGTCATARGYAGAVAYLYHGTGIQPDVDGYTQYKHV